jgi:hypothetical protein
MLRSIGVGCDSITDTPATGHQKITIRDSVCRWRAEPVSVVVVTIDTDHVPFTESQPYRCGRGHWLLPDRMMAGTVTCSCRRGRHTTWECECGDITYAPKLKEACALRR